MLWLLFYFGSSQVQLEADRQAEAAHAKLLQDEVVRLQERIAALLAAGGGRDTDTVSDQDGKVKREWGGEGKGVPAAAGCILNS